jgi:ABC-type iron transport system FetAB permease component
MSEHESHGHSVAAWTAVTILLVASAVMALSVIFPSVFWFSVSWVLVLVGVVAGKVLSMAGYGEKRDTTPSRTTKQDAGVR